VDLVTAFKPPLDFALTIDLNVDWRVLLFTLALSLTAGLIFGLVPALQATKPDVLFALKDEAAIGSYRRSRMRGGLVVAQVALSLVLLVASGLIVRGLRKVQTIGPGFDTERAVTMSVDLKLQGYTEKRGLEFCRQLMTRLEALPGVRVASLTNYLPLALDRSDTNIYIEGQPAPRRADVPAVQNSNVWSRYFEAMGIALVQGREFTENDGKKDSPLVSIINEAFARRFWPGQNPIGKRLKTRPKGPLWEVVGVAKTGKYWSLGESPQPFIYFPMERDCCSSAALVARTSGDAQALIRAIRQEVQRLDASLPVFDVKTMDEHMRLSLFPLRTGAWVAGGFALIALTLAALGLYGVMAYSVSQRTREIGIRMALGARRKDVLGLVLKQGMRLALVGLCIGLAGALAATRLMSAVLYGVSPTDAVTFALVSSLLAAAVLMACFIPARRATKVDPMVALRYE
jgi:predicted permease